jgi:hypothetical protein
MAKKKDVPINRESQAQETLTKMIDMLHESKLSYIEILGIVRVTENVVYEEMVQKAHEMYASSEKEQKRKDRPDYLG